MPPITTSDEAEAIAKEFVTKNFGFQDLQTLTTVFDTYKYFTVTVEAQKHSELKPSVEEKADHDTEVHPPRFYDVKVDPNGVVVGFVRTIRASDEAEEIAKEHAAKTFGFQDFHPLTTTFDGTYYTVTVWREGKDRRKKHLSEAHEGGGKEDLAAAKQPSVTDTTNVPPASNIKSPTSKEDTDLHYREAHGLIYCDVKVDKNGLVVGLVRTIRTADEAEAIVKEYARERHELEHFICYSTTFDGYYFTVYAGGISLGKGLKDTAHKIYKSNFYDVKVDKNGLVVGWTTEGKIAHFTAKLQRMR